MIVYLLVFALLAAAARGLYLRERREALRLQMALIRETMAGIREDQEEAERILRCAQDDRQSPTASRSSLCTREAGGRITGGNDHV